MCNTVTHGNDLAVRMSNFTGKIHFYEWSNPNSSPRIYYSITRFITFLGTCNIKLERFELELLLNLTESYVTCIRGKRELIIRNSWGLLKNSF